MNQKEFTDFYYQNIDKVFRFFYLRTGEHEVAQDLTSLAFLKFWEKTSLDAGNPVNTETAGKLTKNPNIRRSVKNNTAFLYKINHNLLVDFYRQQKHKNFSLDELFEKSGYEIPELSTPSLLDEKLEVDMVFKKVQQALKKINTLYSEVIIWHYLDDLSITEISQILNKTEGAARVLLHRALQALKKEVELI